MAIGITKYNLLCSLGNDIDSAFEKALNGVSDCFCVTDEIIKEKNMRLGLIDCELSHKIDCKDYDLRCNKLVLECLKPLNVENLTEKYGAQNVAVVVATTNSGTMEYSDLKNPALAKLSNPAEFVKKHYGLKNYSATVSTACSSGIKAFSIALDLIESGYAEAVLVISVDSLSKIPVFGFESLEILSQSPSIPFSKNRKGINISEGVCAFVIEKGDVKIEIAGIGETTDCFHPTTPDPQATEAVKAIKTALEKANLTADDIDYINLHGTGTMANDLMEAKAVYEIFKDKTSASSTKPLTGHCLGAASGVETALCCKLIESNSKKVFPHVYDGEYDEEIPKIKLATKDDCVEKMENILCLSFGFGGSDTALVLRKGNI